MASVAGRSGKRSEWEYGRGHVEVEREVKERSGKKCKVIKEEEVEAGKIETRASEVEDNVRWAWMAGGE